MGAAPRGASEIPLLLTLFYLFRESEAGLRPSFWTQGPLRRADPGGRHCQVGSLAGAARLLDTNTGVLRATQGGQKPPVEHKGKCCLHTGSR